MAATSKTLRKPFQGVGNIIRFNWHFYLLSFFILILLFFARNATTGVLQSLLLLAFWSALFTTLVSLFVSYYVYDVSNLYELDWVKDLQIPNKNAKIININAGFDETSMLLKDKFKNAELLVFDFYDPTKHTEVSIKRARKAYPPYPNTQTIQTTHISLQNNTIDAVFAILSAHEIRDEAERIAFFQELQRVLQPNGIIAVTEHLRDTANLLAYNIGFLHFHSKTTWLHTFEKAGLKVKEEIKITPFISTFILQKNGITP
ncbi:MAG: class I SAM-dependent methyltransferase [Chitinophagales bacterium]